MHPIRILIVTAVAAPLAVGAAAAQVPMYPGQDVSVNPSGVKGGQVLLYPGGKMARVVPPLREPEGKYGPIHLHMPVKHRAAARVASAPPEPAISIPAESQNGDTAPAETAPPPPKPAKSRRRVALTPTPSEAPAEAPAKSQPESTVQPAQAASNGPAMPFTFGEPDESGPPPPPAQQKPMPKVATLSPPPAAAKPEAPASSGEKLAKRGVILFNKDATEPVPAAAQGLSMLAGNLSDALLKGAERIEILAYGGAPGDKSSDARRLSLKRALTIRQLLIDRGVPSDRIDVRAMGGADSGEPNRVDIFVKTG